MAITNKDILGDNFKSYSPSSNAGPSISDLVSKGVTTRPSTKVSPFSLVDDEILRDYNFELIIFDEQDDPLVYRVRSANIPQRSVEMIAVDVGGMRRNIPGRALFDGKLSVIFEETENMDVLTTLTTQLNKNHNFDVIDSPGFLSSIPVDDPARGFITRIRLDNLHLRLLKYDGSEAQVIKFHKAILESIGSTQLSYESNTSVKIEASFAFDFWTIGNKANG